MNARCLNCDEPIPPRARFCAHCGQRTDTARLSFADIWRDLMHSWVNIERGPLAFAWALLVRPGVLAREYVQGKRRRHYGPFATLVVIVGLTALAIKATGVQILAHDGLPAGPAELLQRHFNFLLLAQVPLNGIACALVFRAAGLTLPEHMVLAAYTMSVRALAVVLVVPVTLGATGGAPSFEQSLGFWGLWYLYFGWAATQFYAGSRAGRFVRGVVAAAIGHATIMGLLAAGSVAWEMLASRRA